jgi:hypothetical protein
LTLSGTTFNHTNAITAGEAGPVVPSGTQIGYGDAFTVPYIEYDAQGHITVTTDKTVIMPSAQDLSHTLDNHSNVTITEKTTGDLIQWDGIGWINVSSDTVGRTTFVGLTDTPNNYPADTDDNNYFVKVVTTTGQGTALEFVSQLDCGGYTVAV